MYIIRKKVTFPEICIMQVSGIVCAFAPELRMA